MPEPPKKPDITRPLPVTRIKGDQSVTRPTVVVGTGKKPPPPSANLREVRPMLVTDGMLARRREMAKRKKKAEAEKLRLEAESGVRWSRNRKIGFWLLVAGLLGFGYWQLQSTYHNKWPLFAVWIVICIAVLAGFFVMIWYIDSGE